MSAVLRRGQRFHRITHRIGLLIALPLVALAAWAAVQGWLKPDFDEKNEILGIAIFAPLLGLAAYGLSRAVGFFLIELFD
jgi:hypothetical protein